jgi:hypothetical protein
VPGVSIAGSQSGQNAIGSGQDTSTGMPFGAFAFPSSVHTAMPVVPSGDG